MRLLRGVAPAAPDPAHDHDAVDLGEQCERVGCVDRSKIGQHPRRSTKPTRRVGAGHPPRVRAKCQPERYFSLSLPRWTCPMVGAPMVARARGHGPPFRPATASALRLSVVLPEFGGQREPFATEDRRVASRSRCFSRRRAGGPSAVRAVRGSAAHRRAFAAGFVFAPPLTEAPKPLAVLRNPPLTVAKSSLAMFSAPPLTQLAVPEASL